MEIALLILDTSAYIRFKQGDLRFVERMAGAQRLLVSAVVLGELLYGFRNGTRFETNLQELDAFISHPAVEVVHVSEVSADRYSRIAHDLKLNGSPIPSNDIWIAAQTMEYGAELLSSDPHFNRVPGLVHTLLV